MSNYRIAFAAAGMALGLMLSSGRAFAEPAGTSFAGSFANDKLSVTLNASGEAGYTGEIHLGNKTFPIQAKRDGADLRGKFSDGTNDFDFTATLSGQTLSLNTGTSHYTLDRVVKAVNPLDAPAAAVSSPAAAPAATPAASDVVPLTDVQLPKGFSELGSTPSGRVIFSNFNSVGSIDELIQHVGDALAGMFGGKPQFTSACVDAKNKSGGVANFSATLAGGPIKGVVLFGVNPHGVSSATVIYTRPNTPADEFMTLMRTVPAQPKMHTTQMPDGSGSIDIPEGWTCKTQSMTAGPILVTGPKEQAMLIGARLGWDTPDGTRVQVVKRSHDSAVLLYNAGHQRGNPPKSLEAYLAPMNISAALGPEDTFAKLIPKFQEKMRDGGKPWQSFGDVSFKVKVPPMIPGDEAVLLGMPMNWHTPDNKTGPTKRMMLRIETTTPDALGSWTALMDHYTALEETASTDFPLMAEIYKSINIPQAAVKRQLDKDDKAFQSMSAYFQAKNDALLERGRQFQQNQKDQFDRFEQQQAAQSQARHDACSDMIESSLGVRDVLDTATGKMAKVDLYNSTGITDTLNGLANDPNRFVQIPLRYER